METKRTIKELSRVVLEELEKMKYAYFELRLTESLSLQINLEKPISQKNLAIDILLKNMIVRLITI